LCPLLQQQQQLLLLLLLQPLAAATVAAGRAPRDAHEITSLPGWAAPLPSRQWSGLIDAKSWGSQTHQQ
jgi:hypothetical protein